MSRPTFRNKLAKVEDSHNLSRHHDALASIAQSSQREFVPNETYKQLLRSNSKGEYMKSERRKEIELENRILLDKMSKIKRAHHVSSYWGQDYSHSLNSTSRHNSSVEIERENQRIRDKILRQKPSVSFEQTEKQHSHRQKWLGSISKMERYRLPEIHKGRLAESTWEV